MTNKMDLGPLEFKAEDLLDDDLREHLNNPTLMPILKRAAESANRLLAERLEKAPEVIGWMPTEKQYGTWVSDDVPSEKFALDKATHRARLVCIEKLEKSK